MTSCHCAHKNGSLVVQLKLLSFTSWKKKFECFCNNKTSFSNSPLSMLVKEFVMQTIIRFVLCSNICVYIPALPFLVHVISDYWASSSV